MRNLPKQWRALRGLASRSSKNRTPRTQPEHQTTGPSKSNSASHSFGALGMDLNADIDEVQSTKRAVIESIGSNSFTISGVRVSGSVLIMPHISTIWNVDRFSQIQPPAFALIKLMNPRPDICIIGTGAQLLPMSSELTRFFRSINVKVESMDTKNACHTFNVLNQEARNVSAALMPIGYRDEYPSHDP